MTIICKDCKRPLEKVSKSEPDSVGGYVETLECTFCDRTVRLKVMP